METSNEASMLGTFIKYQECRRMGNIRFLFWRVGHKRKPEVGEVKEFSLAHVSQLMDGDIQQIVE